MHLVFPAPFARCTAGKHHHALRGSGRDIVAIQCKRAHVFNDARLKSLRKRCRYNLHSAAHVMKSCSLLIAWQGIVFTPGGFTAHGWDFYDSKEFNGRTSIAFNGDSGSRRDASFHIITGGEQKRFGTIGRHPHRGVVSDRQTACRPTRQSSASTI